MRRNLFKWLGRLTFLLSGLILFSIQNQAQIAITGKVTDGWDASPLIGATVFIKNSTKGTITDIDGSYSIDVSSSEDVLVCSFIGYNNVEVLVGNKDVVNFVMEPVVNDLSEVVVVGYGTQKKEDLTGAVSLVSSKDLEKSNATDISKALQGRAAGVNMSSTSGRPGAAMSIRVRGVGSISNNAQPIVVIDGVITGTGDLSSLNPNDIESVSVLKDAASAAIYGAQASNGVILVKTKKGSAGKPTVKLSAQLGISQLPRRMDVMNAAEYASFYDEAYSAHNKRFADYPSLQRTVPYAYTFEGRKENGNQDTDWQDVITNSNAISQNYSFSMSGGAEKSSYLISGSHTKENGVLDVTYRDMTNFRVNSSVDLSDWLTVGENMSFVVTDGREEMHLQGNVWSTATSASPLMALHNSSNLGGYEGPSNAVTGRNDVTNPYAELQLVEKTNNSNRIFGDIFAEILLARKIKFRSSLGVNYASSNNRTWIPKFELGLRPNLVASLNESMGKYRQLQFDNNINYSDNFNDHNFSFLLGHTIVDRYNNNVIAAGRNFPFEQVRTIRGALETSGQQFIDEVKMQSYFGRFLYDYKGRYLFQAVFRHDQSSKFGSDYRKGNFPSISAGWKLNEDLLTNIDVINLLKLRVGYGETGNLPDRNYLYQQTISPYSENVYTFGSNDTPAFGAVPFYMYATPSLKWETAIMTNFGVDVAMFNNKLQFTGEYYQKKMKDMIMELPLQALHGQSNDADPPLANMGDIFNTGFEFNASYRNMEGVIKYSINANLTTVNNEVTRLPVSEQLSANGYATTRVGNSVGSYYGWVADGLLSESDFQRDADGSLLRASNGAYISTAPFQAEYSQPGDIKFKDLNKDGIINELDRTVIGKIIPDFTYGINVDLAFKNVDLSLFFNGVQNIDMYNGYYSVANLSSGEMGGRDYNKLNSVNNYWTAENGVTNQTAIGINDYNRNSRISTWWIEDASYMRLRNLQIGYTLPSGLLKIIGASHARIFIGGENLLTLTKYSGYDPEISDQSPNSGVVDNGRYPVPRTFIAGLSMTF